MAIKAFAIYNSDFGTQNFVRSGWAEFNQDELTRAVRKEAIKGLEPPAPRLIEDPSGAIVALATMGRMQFGDMVFMIHKYACPFPFFSGWVVGRGCCACRANQSLSAPSLCLFQGIATGRKKGSS